MKTRLTRMQAERMRHTVIVGLIHPMVEDWLDMHKALGEPEGEGVDVGSRDEWQAIPESWEKSEWKEE